MGTAFLVGNVAPGPSNVQEILVEVVVYQFWLESPRKIGCLLKRLVLGQIRYMVVKYGIYI